MEKWPVQAPLELVGASYNIYRYTDQIYKIVHFKNPRVFVETGKNIDRSKKGGQSKMDAAISRAKRMVLEYALCNDWEWFGTFTLDKTKYDRFNLAQFYKDFTQWIRDQRKKYKVPIRYVLIPEMHQDGAWHMHGMLSGLPDLVAFSDLREKGWVVPDRLVDGNYCCWTQYHGKFGFNSMGRIRNHVACGFYVAKYIGKSLQDSGVSVGSHLYYASHGLNRSQFHGDVYGECGFLDHFTVNHYDFCDTGMTHVKDNFDWTFALDFMDHLAVGNIEPLVFDASADAQSEFEAFYEGVQEAMEGFL